MAERAGATVWETLGNYRICLSNPDAVAASSAPPRLPAAEAKTGNSSPGLLRKAGRARHPGGHPGQAQRGASPADCRRSPVKIARGSFVVRNRVDWSGSRDSRTVRSASSR